MTFEFATAGRILFGEGKAGQVPRLGSKALVVYGRDWERVRATAEPIGDVVPFSVEGEPTVEAVRGGAAAGAKCDWVMAIGGGSAIDAGKAIAGVLANGGDPLDYMEVVGAGKPLWKPSLPMVAVATTAGAGAEVTRNAVIRSAEHRVKASLRSPYLLPGVAIVDPLLTHTLPRSVTAATGLDALTQLIESYLSCRANAMTDIFCLEGLRLAAGALPRLERDLGDRDARRDMALASLMGGLALANAGLGIVHGFAAPIGGMFEAPHGAVCAALLPAAIDVNERVMRRRGNGLRRFATVENIAPRSLIGELIAGFEVPGLRAYGVSDRDVPELVAQASKASSTKGNPVVLDTDEMTEILERSL